MIPTMPLKVNLFSHSFFLQWQGKLDKRGHNGYHFFILPQKRILVLNVMKGKSKYLKYPPRERRTGESSAGETVLNMAPEQQVEIA